MTVTGFTETALPGPYARAASPARYAVERGDWKAAAALEVRPSPLPQVQAITHFARAVGAAALGRSGRRQGRRRQAWRNARQAGPGQGRLLGRAGRYPEADRDRLVLYAEGKRDEALAAMSAAADAEDKTEKHPVTPGVPKPAREFYAGMLLESGMAKEALAAFEATLKKEPNRLDAYVGAAKAAEKAGDPAKAREYYGKVVAIASDADKARSRRQRRARVPREEVVRALLLLVALGALARPGPKRIASGDRICRRAGRVGADGHGRHGKGFPANPGIRRTLDDEACRLVHAGRPGGEDR